MAETNTIQPHQVTKPIQLLAAWLVGLICIDGIFLEVALRLDRGSWERGWLVLAAILNVPAFLTAMFTLQTRFRAELQDDTHYARYLSKKTAESVALAWFDADEPTEDEAANDEPVPALPDLEEVETAQADLPGLAAPAPDWSRWRVAINDHLPRFAQVSEALRAAGIPVAEVFGNAHGPASAPPDNWVVSINRAMPVGHKAALLRVLLPFGFDGFQLWNPVSDADENEDVYIGSYGVGVYARFDDELRELLAGTVADADLEWYRKRHKVRDGRVAERSSA